VQIYAIRIRELTNHLLINDGWRTGTFMRECENAYSGPSFQRVSSPAQGSFYTSAEDARRSIVLRHASFVGVTFQIVVFSEDL